MILMIDFPPNTNMKKESVPEITARNKKNSIEEKYKKSMKKD